MKQLVAALPAIFYAVALTLGFLGVPQPFGAESLGPTLQWMLSLGLGVPSLWSAFSHAVSPTMSPSPSVGHQALSKRKSPAPIWASVSALSRRPSWGRKRRGR